MYIDIALAFICGVSGYLLWRRVAQKMPELIVIPDQEIAARLQDNSAKMHLFMLHLFHFRLFYQKRHYQEKLWSFLAKAFFKIHILLLRLDNSLIVLLKRIRSNGTSSTHPVNGSEDYWQGLKNEEHGSLSKIARVEEVRFLRNSTKEKQ